MKYPKMNKAWKKKWVKALRSGKFKQGQGELYTPKEQTWHGKKDEYCCLGVLCKIIKKKTPPQDAFLSPHVARKAGLSGLTQYNLARFNDDLYEQRRGRRLAPCTFRGIATWIEKNL